LLFVPAGTWHWPGAWVFLGFMLASGLLFGGWLAKSSPELLAERMRAPIQKDQPAADKKINGRDGLDPVRYGDWEVKGIASDF